MVAIMQKPFSPRRAYIIDPCLGNMTGHWENFCRRIYGELEKRGIESCIICQKNPNPAIIAGLRVLPAFTRSPYTDMSTHELYLKECLTFMEEFSLIDTGMFKDGDWLICPTIFPQILRPLLEWIDQVKSGADIRSAIIFQFPAGNENTSSTHDSRVPAGISWAYDPMIERYLENKPLVHMMGHEEGVDYYASSQPLADNFSTLFGIAVNGLPMPAPLVHDAPHAAKTGRVTIGHFGHAALAKGTQFLEEIITLTLAAFPRAEFLIHSNPNPETTAILQRLSQLRERVSMASGHIGQDALLSLMAKSDIALLPYDPAKYKTTPSAIFTECAAMGKVLVVPADTWMASEAQAAGLGHVLFDQFNAAAITQALHNAIQNYETLKQVSLKNRQRFLDTHGAAHFVDKMLAALKT